MQKNTKQIFQIALLLAVYFTFPTILAKTTSNETDNFERYKKEIRHYHKVDQKKTTQVKPIIDPINYETIPNIGYLGQGYNIVFGNPNSLQGQDPGFRNYPIFNVTYTSDCSESIQRGDKYLVPNLVQIISFNNCFLNNESQVIYSAYQYRNELEEKIQFDNLESVIPFSGSAEYLHIKSRIESVESAFYQQFQQCEIIKASILELQTSPFFFTTMFVEEVRALYLKGSAEAYYDFFDKVGTHVTTSIGFGARHGIISEIKRANTKKIEDYKENLNQLFQDTFNGKPVSETLVNNNLTDFLEQLQLFSFGSPIVKGSNEKYNLKSLENLMPVSVELIDMTNILRQNLQQFDFIPKNQFETLIENLTRHLETYCQNRLLPSQKVKSCTADPPTSKPLIYSKNKLLKYIIESGKKVIFQQIDQQEDLLSTCVWGANFVNAITAPNTYCKPLNENNTFPSKDSVLNKEQQINCEPFFNSYGQTWQITLTYSKSGKRNAVQIKNADTNLCLQAPPKSQPTSFSLNPCNIEEKDQIFYMKLIKPDLQGFQILINSRDLVCTKTILEPVQKEDDDGNSVSYNEIHRNMTTDCDDDEYKNPHFMVRFTGE